MSATNPKGWTWADPTTNVDGSAVTPGELTGFNIGVRSTTAAGSAAGTYPIVIPVTDPAATAETLAQAQAAGTAALKDDNYQSSIQAVSAGGASAWAPESDASAFTIQTVVPVPNPPTGFTVA